MMEVIKLMNNEENIETYELRKDNQVMGVGTIALNNKVNKIYIEIKNEFQSNGYGTFLFCELLDILRKKGYKQIELIIKRSNYKIINIINKFDPICESTNKEYVKYLLPLVTKNI